MNAAVDKQAGDVVDGRNAAGNSPAGNPLAGPSVTRERVFAAIAWLLPFSLVLYLGLRAGGYDSVVRDQVAAVLWVAILLGAVTGFLPAVRVTRAAWIALAFLAGFGAWTALSTSWSESVERSWDVVPLIGAYLAVFALALMTSRRETIARTVSAVGGAVGVIAVVALLSRFHPAWFPEDQTIEQLPEVASRLKYPFGSWNGLAGFIGMGIPLLLAVAVNSRTAVARALAAVAIPVSSLAIGYTLSRGGLVVALIGVSVFVVLHSRRTTMLPTLGVVAAGSVAALLASSQYDALKNLEPGFVSQQDDMILITLGISIAVALAMLWVSTAERKGSLPQLKISQTTSRQLTIGWAIVLAAIVVAAGATGVASNAWQQFKSPAAPGTTAERVSSGSGNQRYQQWEAAVSAAGEAPLEGKGAGTYELWWSRTAPIPGYSRYAHSLYFETLAETGVVGMALIVGLIGFVLVVIVRLTLRASDHRRGWLAGAAGSGTAFAFAAGIDWAWSIPAVPVAFFLIAGAALQSQAGATPPNSRRGESVARLVAAGLAIAFLWVTMVSWLGAQRMVDSRQAVRAGDLDAALRAAEAAAEIQPYAATPHLQQALILEEQGNLDAALTEVTTAIGKNFFDWEPRWVLSRIEERRGRKVKARIYYERARQLNPWSPIFLNDQDKSALTPD